jgi:ABC transporter
MATNRTSVHEICTQLLHGLDDDIREYVIGALEETEFQGDTASDEEHYEMVSNFLQSSGYLEDEDEAMEKARQVVSRVRAFKCSVTNAATGKDRPQELSEQVKRQLIVADNCSSEANNTADLLFPKNTVNVNKNTLIDQDEVSDSLAKQAKKRDEKVAKKKIRDTKLGRLDAAEQAEADRVQLELELQQARIAAVQARSKLGAYKGSLDAKSFTLPNPGGGQPLLEDAACRLDWGKRYGLIGRNGMVGDMLSFLSSKFYYSVQAKISRVFSYLQGKSTLLRAFAARHVGSVPVNVTVHYVSQEVNLTADQAKKTPVECVVEADLERTLLLNECRDLELQAAAGELSADGSTRHGTVLARLEEINADSAHRRAQDLLTNLGFSQAFQQRPLKELSGGWRVRTMLAAAIFAKPDMLLLDEPTSK